MAETLRFAGVELGGTKCIAVLAHDSEIIARDVQPTGAPEETLGGLNAILREWDRERPLAGMGIASFGPLQLDSAQQAFGTMLTTPKRGWQGTRVAEVLTRDLACPWRIDTDVNAAALAEYRWGAATHCSSVCYITIGTGVGGGLLLEGRPVHGAMHPEIGHLRLRRAPGDGFAGTCSFHGDCIEGLISGPALAARFGCPAAQVPDDHPLWDHVAHDLGELLGAILLTHSANRILLGGSVPLTRQFLLPLALRHLVERLGNYLPYLDEEGAKNVVRLAGLGSDAGPLGAVALAQSVVLR